VIERHARNWWTFAIRGAAAIAFGVVAILLPGITLLALVLLFAAYAIVDGASAIVAGLRESHGGLRESRGGGRDWWSILVGIAGIVAGLLAVVWPNMTALVLLLFIGAWAIASGAFEVIAAYRFRDRIPGRGELLLALDGIVSVAFGAFVILLPGAGALAVVWLIGAYAIVSGVVLFAIAARLYRHHQASGDTTREGDVAATT
jgi:uncharacterized membrane protein HdeD (DUF308 family)